MCPSPASGLVVRFDKETGAAEERVVRDLDTSFSAFKAALYLWRMGHVQQFEKGTETAAAPPEEGVLLQ